MAAQDRSESGVNRPVLPEARGSRPDLPVAAKVILIVDDSEDDIISLQQVLKRAGLTNPIRSVTSGTDAIAYLRGDPPFADRVKSPMPALIFLDLKMRGLDGFDVLHWIQINPDCDKAFLVALSGLEELSAIRRAYSLGADTFLVKPCGLADVENLLHGFPACRAILGPPLPPANPGGTAGTRPN